MADWETAPAVAPTVSKDGWESAPVPERTGSAKSLHDMGQLGRGVASGALGLPGAMEEFGLSLVPGGDKEKRVFPTPSEVDKKLFAPATDEHDKALRTGGEFVGGLATPGGIYGAGKGLVKAIPAGAEALISGGRVAKDLLPGATKKAQEAVSAIGDVSDISTLGNRMYKDLSGRLNTLTKDRQATAKKLKGDYLNQPIEKEREIVSTYQAALDDALKTTARDLSPDQVKFINESKSRLAGDPSMEAIEIERRRLGDIQSGAQEGYGAIEKQFAGVLKNKLTGILRDKVPASGKFIDAYHAQSEPIDLFNSTVLGKKATKGASEYLPDVPKFDPIEVPKAAFKSKFTMDMLKRLTDNDMPFINSSAGEYAATQLKDLGAKEARKWLTKNKDWLDEVPAVQKEAEQYVKRLESVSLTQKRGKYLGAAVGGAAVAGAAEHVF